MKKIDIFVDSIYRNVDGNNNEIQELKQEMKSHLHEKVYELKSKGMTEEQAINLALETFGDKKQLLNGLAEFFNIHRIFARNVLIIAILSLILGAFFFFKTTFEICEFKKEKERVMESVLNVLENSDELNGNKKDEIYKIYKDNQNHINKLAIFSTKEDPSLQKWVKDNEFIKYKIYTIYPISYKKARVVFNSNGLVGNEVNLETSKYDLGTVATTTDNWIVQFEYNNSYQRVIEANNSFVLGNYLDIFQLPIIFLVITVVLLLIWGWLKKYHKQYLKSLIS